MIGAPRLLASVSRAGGEIALWLEDVNGLLGTAWPLERYATASRSLGRAQGRLLVDRRLLTYPWLSPLPALLQRVEAGRLEAAR